MFVHPKLLQKKNRIVAGHRGVKALLPENTMLSFEKAIEMDVDMIEMDLNVTSDGQLIVIHDLSVDRTTNGTGLVRELTLKEIKKMDAGIKFSTEFKGIQIPTFEEFCQLVVKHPNLLLNVEIKDYSEECVIKSIEILEQYNLLQRSVFTCFDADILKIFHLKYDLPTQGFLGFKLKNFEPGLKGSFSHMTAIGIEMGLLTPERVKDFEEMGILPWAYCPDNDIQAAYARYCDVWLVTCNDPRPSMRIFKA